MCKECGGRGYDLCGNSIESVCMAGKRFNAKTAEVAGIYIYILFLLPRNLVSAIMAGKGTTVKNAGVLGIGFNI